MDTETRTGGQNMGLGATLFVVFLVLKLTGVINWSWWWVFAPLWIPLMIIIPVILLIAIMASATNARFKASLKPKRSKEVDSLFKMMPDLQAEIDRRAALHSDLVEVTPIEKSVRRHKKKVNRKRFSLKQWWKEGCKGPTIGQRIAKWWTEGNKKAAEKKVQRKSVKE